MSYTSPSQRRRGSFRPWLVAGAVLIVALVASVFYVKHLNEKATDKRLAEVETELLAVREKMKKMVLEDHEKFMKAATNGQKTQNTLTGNQEYESLSDRERRLVVEYDELVRQARRR